MRWIFFAAILLAWTAGAEPFTAACKSDNDLINILHSNGVIVRACNSARLAMDEADADGAVLLLADEYPAHRVRITPEDWREAKTRNLTVYVEFPESVPGVELGAEKTVEWERAVVTSDFFGTKLARNRILSISGSHYFSCGGGEPLMVMARVAGFDDAVYGVPKSAAPILVDFPDRKLIVATTKLSGFVTGRYGPMAEWGQVWRTILRRLQPKAEIPELRWTPSVAPALQREEKPPKDFERAAFDRAAQWFLHGRLLVSRSRLDELEAAVRKDASVATPAIEPPADGSLGILEGYASAIRYDGNQLQRSPVRADCQAESAMVIALDAKLNHSDRSAAVAKNLLNFLYNTSGIHGGVRANPQHPAFGLIAWGIIAPAWERATYGDDDARVILGTILATASLDTSDYDEHLLRALVANLRTTGTQGFRGDRIDMPDIEAKGWKAYHDAATLNYSPHFESYLWACNLWAYRQTGDREFLDRTKVAIAKTMAANAKRQWRWNDSIERARMILCLAWLIRIEDTPEHRGWLTSVAHDLLEYQDPCGAIPDRLSGEGGGHYRIPGSNEAYGTGETPLIQKNGDPVSDQLYTTGFALFGLHEAVAATGDEKLRDAEDHLADYLCRIQVRSTKVPYLDGTWFRAFDFKKWDYWSSSADIGWGAWSAEAGWAQAWTAATLALREERTSFWEVTAKSRIADQRAKVEADMAKNTGGPWTGKPWAGGETRYPK